MVTDAMLPSGHKYDNMLPSVYRRLLEEELKRHKSAREAEKAARKALHGLAEAYFPREAYKRALALLGGGSAAPDALLKLHASTRERMDAYDALMDAMRALWPDAHSILDIGCGINPVALGEGGYAVVGLDMHLGCVEIVNACARRFGLPIEAFAADLLEAPAMPPSDIALMLKLLPLLERQRAGAGAELLTRAPARRMVASFPSKTMSGRDAGMRAHYRTMLDGLLPAGATVKDTLETRLETFYFLEKLI